ncbi:MAG TPA: hypothetical protein VIL20_10405 [Sandaracinaceae bacterium]
MIARALAVVLVLAPSHAAADWDARVSARLALGGGVYVPEAAGDPWPLFEMALRSDLLFGEARPARVRFGPALDLRTEGFRTFEVAGALAVLLPVERGFALTVGGGAGWGARPEGRDGPLGLAQVAFGWRPYNYFGAYAWAVNLYAAGRVQFVDPRAWEITIGIELDFELLFVIPFMFFWELAEARDPDEPLTSESPRAGGVRCR